MELQAAGSAQVNNATSAGHVAKQVPGPSSDRDTHKPKTSQEIGFSSEGLQNPIKR